MFSFEKFILKLKKKLIFKNLIIIFFTLLLELSIILIWFYVEKKREWFDISSIISTCFILMSIIAIIFNYKKNNRNIFPSLIENFKIKNNSELTKIEKTQMKVLDIFPKKNENENNENNVFFIALIIIVFSFSLLIATIPFLVS